MRDAPGQIQLPRCEKHTTELVVDRLRARPDQRTRLMEALGRAIKLGSGVVSLSELHRTRTASPTSCGPLPW